MKNFVDFLKIILVAAALWLVTKFFNKDEEIDPTQTNTGLSADDLSIYNDVIINLNSGGNPNDFSWWGVILPPIYGINQNEYTQLAVKLAKMLADVQDKVTFAKVFAKRQKRTLVNTIIAVYGEDIYNLISKNVPDFVHFMI